MSKIIDEENIGKLIDKKLTELKQDLLQSRDIKELNDKLDTTINLQNQFFKKMQSLVMLIDGAYNVNTIKTPTKIATKKPKQNNNVIDINTPIDPNHTVIISNTSTPIQPTIDEKSEISKPKYRIRCINAIMDGTIKLVDLENNCNINITEVKKQLSDIKSSTTLNAMEKKEQFKNTLKEFINKIGEPQNAKLKKYISEKLPNNNTSEHN